MPAHLKREIDNLKKKILQLGAHVEESVSRAVRSFRDREARMAEEVIDNDRVIDALEVEIEEDCLKILALYQPVAIDLRFLVAVLKINNDLERIGDLSVNIAERALSLAGKKSLPIPNELEKMQEHARAMLGKSLDALVNLDAGLAMQVCAMDDELDQMNREMYEMLRQKLDECTENSYHYIHLLTVSRQLERIGDQATNIAEDVVYMIEGRIIRHKEI
jgi:phosphate transport system protein